MIRPDRRGHSSSKVLLRHRRGVEVALLHPDVHDLAARLAERAELLQHAVGRRLAELLFEFAAGGAKRSSSPHSPLGIDQAAASFLAQKGPPMWPMRTWRTPSRTR